MRYIFPIFIVFLFSCSEKPTTNPLENTFYLSADLSALPMLESKGIEFYEDSVVTPMLISMRWHDYKTIRMRLWKNPEGENSGFEQVKAFADRIHSRNMNVWLTVHYSDTWADPGHQALPEAWKGLSFNALKDSCYNYTAKIMQEIKPGIIQIGNEINPGIMLPYGDIYENENQFLELLSICSKAVRDNSDKTKIMIHYAGLEGANDFYSKLQSIDYDIIGLSYYPIWHGKDLNVLKTTLNTLASNYDNKGLAIAETAYPFTLEYNDWTNNIVGMEDQLVSGYPADEYGQRDFFREIIRIVQSEKLGCGVSYWGAELVAFNGPEAKDGSPWENQAFYDFNNFQLPILYNLYGINQH